MLKLLLKIRKKVISKLVFLGWGKKRNKKKKLQTTMISGKKKRQSEKTNTGKAH